MSTLIATTVGRHPDSGQPVALRSGDAVPDWAEGMIGDHLLAADDPAPSKPKPATRGRSK